MVGSNRPFIIGGGFQDAEGNPLADGWVILRLNMDGEVTGSHIAAGVDIKIPLDENGDADGSVQIWATGAMSPSRCLYVISAYSSDGLRSWGPWQIAIPQGNTFNLGTILPTNPSN